MRRFLAEHGVPYRFPGRAVMDHVQRVIGARFEHIAPLHTIRSVRCPVLLVHGVHDGTVPYADARRLAAVAPAAELLPVEGGHDLRDALAPHAGDIVGFLRRAMAQPGATGP
jgi:uncharacterized protein